MLKYLLQEIFSFYAKYYNKDGTPNLLKRCLSDVL